MLTQKKKLWRSSRPLRVCRLSGLAGIKPCYSKAAFLQHSADLVPDAMPYLYLF